MPGLTFNNSNWPEIIKLLRFDSLCMAVGTPLFYHISILMGGYQLFDNIKLYALWIVILISIGAVYCIGKKKIGKEITVDISHILGNLITVIFDYQILRKPLKILSL